VFLAFVDESYNDDLFCLSALLADDETTFALTAELDAVIASVASAGYSGARELHGHEMLHGSGEWKHVPMRLRLYAYSQAMRAIGQSGAAVVFCDGGRRIEEGSDPTPPHERTLTRLLGLIQEFAEARSQRVLVLADDVHSAERHRTNFRFRGSGEDGGHAGPRDRILDTLYFGPSRHSRMLQAADLLTYMRLRRATVKEATAKATRANDAMWASVEPIIVAPGSTKAPVG
jgi:hypothetical protein